MLACLSASELSDYRRVQGDACERYAWARPLPAPPGRAEGAPPPKPGMARAGDMGGLRGAVEEDCTRFTEDVGRALFMVPGSLPFRLAQMLRSDPGRVFRDYEGFMEEYQAGWEVYKEVIYESIKSGERKLLPSDSDLCAVFEQVAHASVADGGRELLASGAITHRLALFMRAHAPAAGTEYRLDYSEARLLHMDAVDMAKGASLKDCYHFLDRAIDHLTGASEPVRPEEDSPVAYVEVEVKERCWRGDRYYNNRTDRWEELENGAGDDGENVPSTPRTHILAFIGDS
ncbi:hypothetical protein TeGR_g9558, partial [Tetraparma gracilis]